MSAIELAGTFTPERHHTNTDPETISHERYYARLLGTSALKLGGLTLAGSVALGGFMFKADIDHERAVIAASHSTLIENSPVPDSSQFFLSPSEHDAFKPLSGGDVPRANDVVKQRRLATFNGPGFGLRHVFRADKSLAALGDIGANVSIEYGNRGINSDDLAEDVERYDVQNDITDIGLDFNSMGTIVETKLAVELYKRDPNAHISYIIMDSPAPNAAALRPKSRSDAYAVVNAVRSHIPGIEYSRYLHQFAEDYVRKDLITDIPSFLRINGEEHEEVFNGSDVASNILAEEQAQMIFSADVEDDLKYLGSQPQWRRPVMVFMGAKNPASDDVVNTPKSYEMIKKWTDEAGLTLLGPYGIDDFYHGAQWRSIPEYGSVLREEVIPDIEAELNSR